MTETTEVTRIKPGGSVASLDLAEIWKYRELLYFLTLRDIKIRYKQTLIGVAWVVLQPVLTTAIFTIIFSTFARFDTKSVRIRCSL
jgi:lipopolysaccharide transport system permease protein